LPFSFIEAGERKRRKVDAQITLIPFIDLLLTVVVFLLMSFSASGEVVAQADLPSAEHGSSIETGPVIAIDQDRITVDGRYMAQTRDVAAGAGIERIEPLVRDLEIQARNHHILHPQDEGLVRPVLVLASRDVDFRVVRKVLFSAAQAGFPGAQLTVRQR